MSAFVLSATLHGVVVGILLLLGYAAKQQAQEMPRILELVAGGGNDLGAKLAPRIGVEDGVKLSVPPPPKAETPQAEAPRPEPAPLRPAPPQPKKVEPAPITKAPAPKAPDFKRQITNTVRAADTKAKREIAKQRKAEQKLLAEQAKKKAEEDKKMTKAEFDRMNKMKATAKTPPKVARITTEGIADGVADGSVESKAGQGGKALMSDNDDLMLAWETMFKERMRRAFEPPPGLSDTLTAKVEVLCHADGSLSGAKIVRGSGAAEFDQAIVEAIRRVQLPARPDRKSERIQFEFRARELDQ